MHLPRGQGSRSPGYKNPHGHTDASDHVPYSIYQYAVLLPAAIAGVGLHVDTTACFLVVIVTIITIIVIMYI